MATLARTLPSRVVRPALSAAEFCLLCDYINELFEAECMRQARLEYAVRHGDRKLIYFEEASDDY